MNQKFSVGLFAAGMPAFLATATEVLSNGHNTWGFFYETPLGFLHGVALGTFFMAMIIGALNIQLPRSGQHADRKSDTLLTTETANGTVVITKQTLPAETDRKE